MTNRQTPLLDPTRESLARLTARLAKAVGFNPTGIPGLSVVMRTSRGEKRSFQKPYAALVIQGRKRTRVGDAERVYGPGDIVVTCIDFPSFTTIEEASPEHPFLSCVLELDRKMLADLALSSGSPGSSSEEPPGLPFFVAPCGEALAQNFLRLLALGECPEAAALLGPILVRELHARLLLSPLGVWIRSVCASGTRSNQVATAVSLIRAQFREPLSVPEIARHVGLSAPTLHRHFKSLTGFSPIRYQKMLRLYEGRSLLREGRKTVSGAAFEVGYASSSQFTNDYRRLFGRSPREDARTGFVDENPAAPEAVRSPRSSAECVPQR